MEKKNAIDQQRPKTYAEAAREMNWGGVTFYSGKPPEKNDNRGFLSVSPNSDKYLAGTIPSQQPSQQTGDLEKLRRPEGLPEGISLADIARLAELFRAP